MNIMIHACIDRMHYVEGFLVPTLLKDGWEEEEVEVYEDTKEEGCLKAYLHSFKSLPGEGDTWHLQDDVLPDRRFKWFAEKWADYDGIINAFGNVRFYKPADFGPVPDAGKMFYSFPCLRIPNALAHEFVAWVNANMNKPQYIQYTSAGKYVDWLFKQFIGRNERGIGILNMRPCLVEHVDEYCGGSQVNKQRQNPAKALQFEDSQQLERLKEWRRKYEEEA